MRTRKPPSDRLLFRAAEARAQGKSWATIGKLVRRSPHTVCKWPRSYARRWDAALRAANRAVVELAAAQAVVALQNLLTCENDGIRATAAWRLLYQRLEQWKIDMKLFTLQLPGDPSQDDPNTQALREMSDEQRTQLLLNMRTTPLVENHGAKALPPALAV
jgi:hypothetical protein